MNSIPPGRIIEQETLQLLRGKKQFNLIRDWKVLYGVSSVQSPWYIRLHAFNHVKHFKLLHYVRYTDLPKEASKLDSHTVDLICANYDIELWYPQNDKHTIHHEFDIKEIFK
jgi:hypothetical protein